MHDWFDEVLRWSLLSLAIPIFLGSVAAVPLLVWAAINENPWFLAGLWLTIPVTAMFGAMIKSLWED